MKPTPPIFRIAAATTLALALTLNMVGPSRAQAEESTQSTRKGISSRKITPSATTKKTVNGAPMNTPNTSAATTAPTGWAALAKKLKAQLAIDYTGQAITDLGALEMPDATTGKRSARSVRIDYTALGGYKFNNGWSLSGAYLIRQTPSSLATQKFTMLDPQVRLTNGKVYGKGNFSIGTEVRAGIGLSDSSQATTRKGDVRWFQFANYDINSRLSLGITTFIRGFVYEQRPVDQPLFYVYAGPQVSYSFNDKVQAALLFEYGGLHTSQTGFLATDGTDIEPSVNFQFTPKLSLTPYLDIKTSDRVALDTTTLGANVTYRAL